MFNSLRVGEEGGAGRAGRERAGTLHTSREQCVVGSGPEELCPHLSGSGGLLFVSPLDGELGFCPDPTFTPCGRTNWKW